MGPPPPPPPGMVSTPAEGGDCASASASAARARSAVDRTSATSSLHSRSAARFASRSAVAARTYASTRPRSSPSRCAIASRMPCVGGSTRVARPEDARSSTNLHRGLHVRARGVGGVVDRRRRRVCEAERLYGTEGSDRSIVKRGSTRAERASSRRPPRSSQSRATSGARFRTRCAAPSTGSQRPPVADATQTWGPRAAQSRHARLPHLAQK